MAAGVRLDEAPDHRDLEVERTSRLDRRPAIQAESGRPRTSSITRTCTSSASTKS